MFAIQTSTLLAMTDIVLLHNPRCSKSRQALALLEERGAAFREVRYLDEPLDAAGLRALMAKLGTDDPNAIVRSKEDLYRELELEDADADRLVDAVAGHPVLMERPIAIRGDRAVVARPPERVLELLDLQGS